MDKNIHQGHRKRLRDKFNSFGAAALTDHELFELLLFYSIPRANTNEAAHKLLDEFGSVMGVLTTDNERLAYVAGLGDRSAELISLVGAISARARENPRISQKKYPSLKLVGEYLLDYFKNATDEEFCAIHFNHLMQIVGYTRFNLGSRHNSPVSPQRIARDAILKDASGVVIAHNHHSGESSPSLTDRRLTHAIETALMAVDVCLIEHIIVCDGTYAPTMIQDHASARRATSEQYGMGFFSRFYNG